MKINLTKLYRIWFLLTATSVFGILVTYYMGYNPMLNSWKISLFNLHTIFIGMLFAAVIIRVYMALNKINGVPLMHLIRARTLFQVIVALFYIAMCSALLITLFSEIYLLLNPSILAMTWVHELRNNTQPIFASMVAVHILYVIYANVIKKSGTLKKLLLASA